MTHLALIAALGGAGRNDNRVVVYVKGVRYVVTGVSEIVGETRLAVERDGVEYPCCSVPET